MKHLLIITIAAVSALGQSTQTGQSGICWADYGTSAQQSVPCTDLSAQNLPYLTSKLTANATLVSPTYVPIMTVPDRIQIKYLFLALAFHKSCEAQGKDCEAARALLIPKVEAIFKELKQAGCDAGPVGTRQIFDPLGCK